MQTMESARPEMVWRSFLFRPAQPRRLRREDEDILQLFAWSFHFYRYLCVEREQQTVVESADSYVHRALFPERVMMLFSYKTGEVTFGRKAGSIRHFGLLDRRLALYLPFLFSLLK